MNIFRFLRLMAMIYGKRRPNLEKIQDMGLLAVKIAQHYALRVDFLDEAVCKELQKLYRTARSAPGVSVYELLDKCVAPEWHNSFASIEETPFASASIGQIHRGVLKSGDRVVIKLIKEDFRRTFLKDIASLRRSLQALFFFVPKLQKVFDPLAILTHIEEYTLLELDLRNEIKGAEELRAIRQGFAYDFPAIMDLHFPHFYEELSGPRVLVSRFIEGKTYDEQLVQGGLSYEQLLQLFNLHGLYLFGKGRFHGDMHPGNVIGHSAQSLYFVDTGALSSCGERIRSGLFAFFVALSSDDLVGSARALHSMATTSLDSEHFALFEADFKYLYKDFSGKTVKEVSLTKKMMDTIKLGVNSGMAFDDGMFPIIKSLMYLDGMVLRCNPQAVLLKDMKPFIAQMHQVMEKSSR